MTVQVAPGKRGKGTNEMVWDAMLRDKDGIKGVYPSPRCQGRGTRPVVRGGVPDPRGLGDKLASGVTSSGGRGGLP